MLLADLLWLILSAGVVRAAWRLMAGVIEGMSAPSSHPERTSRGSQVPARGVQMVRDPVCGTYIVPTNALAVSDGSRQVFFCSVTCRDKYRARTA